jgi:hypothetical protein
MAEEKKELPGITFFLDGTEEQGTVAGKLTVRLHLTAIVDEEEMLNRVLKKFEGGFRIHTVEDFKGQMIRVLQEDMSEAERRVRELEVELRNEKNVSSHLHTELQAVRATFGFFKGKGESHE